MNSHKVANPDASKKAILSIDLIKANHGVGLAAIQTAGVLSKALNLKLVSTSIIKSDRAAWPQDFFPDISSAAEESADNDLKDILSNAGVDSDTQILCEAGSSPADAASTFQFFAEEVGAEAILLLTHVADERHWFGGFVTDMLKICSRTIIAINSEAPSVKKLKRILFATSFSEADRSAFEDAIRYAKISGAELVLTKCLVAPVSVEIGSSAGMSSVWPFYETWMGEEAKHSEDVAATWVKKASKRGVSCRFEIVSGFLSVPEGLITKAAEVHADLIIMVGKPAYNFVSILFNSFVFGVVASSQLPVMILRKARLPLPANNVSEL